MVGVHLYLLFYTTKYYATNDGDGNMFTFIAYTRCLCVCVCDFLRKNSINLICCSNDHEINKHTFSFPCIHAGLFLFYCFCFVFVSFLFIFSFVFLPILPISVFIIYVCVVCLDGKKRQHNSTTVNRNPTAIRYTVIAIHNTHTVHLSNRKWYIEFCFSPVAHSCRFARSGITIHLHYSTT